MIRVFLVAEHAVIRVELRRLLAGQPEVLVVGEASNGQDLLAQLPTTPAEVVLLDLPLPVLAGLASTRQLRQQYPALKLLLVGRHQLATSKQLLAAGAHGYLLKRATAAKLLTGVRAVVSEELVGGPMGGLAARPPGSDQRPARAAGTASPSSSLSRRELAVLQLLAEGLTTSEIAAKLFNSIRTIETHRQNILAKRQAKNTAALIRQAMREGLIT